MGNRHPVSQAEVERNAAQAQRATSSLQAIPLLARRAEGVVRLAAPDARVAVIVALKTGP